MSLHDPYEKCPHPPPPPPPAPLPPFTINSLGTNSVLLPLYNPAKTVSLTFLLPTVIPQRHGVSLALYRNTPTQTLHKPTPLLPHTSTVQVPL